MVRAPYQVWLYSHLRQRPAHRARRCGNARLMKFTTPAALHPRNVMGSPPRRGAEPVLRVSEMPTGRDPGRGRQMQESGQPSAIRANRDNRYDEPVGSAPTQTSPADPTHPDGTRWVYEVRRSFEPTTPKHGFHRFITQVCLLPAKGGSSILSRSCPPWIELSCLVLSVFFPRLWHISSVHERRCRPLAQALRIDCKLPIVCLEALTCLTDTCGHATARAARRCPLSVRETSG